MHAPDTPWPWHERLALALYGGLMALARPLLRRKLARRAQAEPGYAHDLAARFGHPPQEGAPRSHSESSPTLWVHAVSLGETRAAAVLLAALRERQPTLRLLLTHSTATGWAEGQRLLRPGDTQTWLPWDDPWSVRRFLRHQQPRVGVLMETEIWPTLIHQAHAVGVPLMLVNARLNERSTRGAQRLAWLSRPAYAVLTVVGAQTEADAQRLQQVGARAVQVWGNLKYDARPHPDQQATARRWRQTLQRPVVMLASSREGEEQDFLKEICALALDMKAQAAIKNAVFLVVPRHPQRFDAVADLLQRGGANVWRRAQWGEALAAGRMPQGAGEGLTVWLGDSLGEMALYATLADVALLGGSFQPLGGQNLIELAACGCPVVVGPHTFNFADATDQALAAGAARRVPDIAQGVQAALQWLADAPAHARATEAAHAWASSQQGAAGRTADAVLALLGRGVLSAPPAR
jgi:3-deoxy-D-manno-octulosonic-acid transferase